MRYLAFICLLMEFTVLSDVKVQAQWLPCNIGLPNDQVLALAVKNNNLFAGTYGGGVFLSTDNGSTWNPVNNGLSTYRAYYIRTLVTIDTNLYAGTDSAGIFLSSNNGSTWKQIDSGLTEPSVLSVLKKGESLYAGTYGGGVFLSTNNGTSWNATNTGFTGAWANYVTVLMATDSDLFAATNGSGIFRSTNNGANWEPINNGITNGQLYSLAAISTSSGSAILFTGTGSSWYGGSGIYRSTDNGDTWTLQLQYVNVDCFVATPNGNPYQIFSPQLMKTEFYNRAMSAQAGSQ